jgi:hypothetical protein
MQTFEGFKTGSCDVHALMRDVDLFLLRLLEEMKVTYKERWKYWCAAYYVPELAATIGFYWWRGPSWREPKPNHFCILKEGEKEPIPIGESLEDVVRNTQNPAKRDQYIAELAARVLTCCGKRAESIAV